MAWLVWFSAAVPKLFGIRASFSTDGGNWRWSSGELHLLAAALLQWTGWWEAGRARQEAGLRELPWRPNS